MILVGIMIILRDKNFSFSNPEGAAGRKAAQKVIQNGGTEDEAKKKGTVAGGVKGLATGAALGASGGALAAKMIAKEGIAGEIARNVNADITSTVLNAQGGLKNKLAAGYIKGNNALVNGIKRAGVGKTALAGAALLGTTSAISGAIRGRRAAKKEINRPN